MIVPLFSTRSLPAPVSIARPETALIEPEVSWIRLAAPPARRMPAPVPAPPRTRLLAVTRILPVPVLPWLWAKMPVEFRPAAKTEPERRRSIAPPAPVPVPLPAKIPSTQPPPPPSDCATTPMELAPSTAMLPVWSKRMAPPLPVLPGLKAMLAESIAPSTAPPPPPIDWRNTPCAWLPAVWTAPLFDTVTLPPLPLAPPLPPRVTMALPPVRRTSPPPAPIDWTTSAGE